MAFDGSRHAQHLPQLKKRRVRTGCLTCRQRKVKCGEESPKCHTCTRLDLDCIYGDPNGEHDDRPPTIRRTRRACDQCRAVKAGCSNERPACARCLALGKECVYPAHASPDVGNTFNVQRIVPSSPPDGAHLWSHAYSEVHRPPNSDAIRQGLGHSNAFPPPSTKPGLINDDPLDSHNVDQEVSFGKLLASKHELHRFLDAYWDKVYNASWYSFLHRPSFMTALDSDNVPDVLIQSMCGAAACFLEPDGVRAAAWMDNVEAQLYKAFKAPTLELLQASLNLIFYDYVNGNGTRTYMTTGFAARMCYALGLSTETDRSDLSFAQRESRRRLMWSLYSIDAMVSGGVREIECIPLDSLHIQLPCNERNFTLSIPCKTRKLHRNITPEAWVPDNTEGLYTQLVTLLIIRKKVMSYVINLARDSSLPWEEGSMFDQCRWLLHHWRQGLGPEIQFTAQNIAARRTGKQINQLFGVHARYWGITYNLFRIAVHGFVEAAGPEVLLAAPHGWLRSVQHECFHAATQVSELCVSLLHIFPDYTPDDCSIPVTLYEALRIQAWAFDYLVPGEEQSARLEQARLRVNSTVEIMLRGEQYHAGSRRLRPNLEKLVARTQLRHIVTCLDVTSFQAWTPEVDDPAQRPSAFGNISKTHLIHAVQEELSHVKRSEKGERSSSAADLQANARLPETKKEPESEANASALPPLPAAQTWSKVISGSKPLQVGASPMNTDLSWLLNPNDTLGMPTRLPNVNGPPDAVAGSPYDDIAAMLSWQWPTGI